MVRVKVINGLPVGQNIILKEGNGDLLRVVKSIPGGRNLSHVVSLDPNATYREFVCVETTSRLRLTLTSDDFLEIAEVKITGMMGSKLVYDIKNRKTGGITEVATDASIGRATESVGEGVKSISECLLAPFTKCLKKRGATTQACANATPQARANATPQARANATPQARTNATLQARANGTPKAGAIAIP